MAEARRLFGSALERAVDPADRARLTLATADAASSAGDYAAARDLALSATSLYDDLDLPLEAGYAAGQAGDSTTLLLDPAGAIALARPRWDALQDVEGAERALIKLAQGLGRAYADLGDTESTWEVADRRLRCAEAYGDPEHIAQAMLALGTGYTNSGAPETSAGPQRGGGADLP